MDIVNVSPHALTAISHKMMNSVDVFSCVMRQHSELIKYVSFLKTALPDRSVTHQLICALICVLYHKVHSLMISYHIHACRDAQSTTVSYISLTQQTDGAVILAQHLPNYLVITIPRLVKNSVSTINPMQIIFIRTGIALQIVPMIIRLMEQIQLPMMFLSCTTATTILKLVLLAWVVLLIILLTILPKIV